MDKTINELTEKTTVSKNDELIIYDTTANTSKKIKAEQLQGLFISASSSTITGINLISGSVVKILFTSEITGSDTTTGLSINYNNVAFPVKVGKNGSLADFVAHDISGTYTYLQAYTTLELAFDGTQFIIAGNPIVLSSANYTIYADGQYEYLSYSTEEVWTGGYWIDRKKIYAKTFKIDSIGNNGVVCHKSDYSIETLVKYEGLCGRGNATDISNLPYATASYFQTIITNTTDIVAYANITLVNAVITLYYTKTTD